MTPTAQTVLRGPLDRIRAVDPTTALCGASLLGLVVVANDDAFTFFLGAAACVLALPRPRLLRSPWLWSFLFAAVAGRQLSVWYRLDDHVIGMTYWCGALALGLRARDPQRTLAASARFLVGTLFAFAASWKLLSGQFADGTFFRYSLLFDDRFEAVARVLGGTSSAVRDANVEAVSTMVNGTGDAIVVVQEGPHNPLVAQVFTVWGMLVEAAVAITFLVPLHHRWGWVRHACLLAFACTTYVIVPVGGFGTLLLVLASAMVTTDRARLAYYVGAVVLVAWSGLWPVLFR